MQDVHNKIYTKCYELVKKVSRVMTNLHTKLPTLLVIDLVVDEENSMGTMALMYFVILLHENNSPTNNLGA